MQFLFLSTISTWQNYLNLIWKLFHACLLNHKAVPHRNFRTCICMSWIIIGKGSLNQNTGGKANKTWQCDTVILFPCLHLYLITEVVYFLSHFIYNQHYKWIRWLENETILEWSHRVKNMDGGPGHWHKNYRTMVAKRTRNSA